jgi:hypothetical protein
MEMKRLSGGNLRAAGYDATRRTLVVEMTSGTFEYGGVSADTFRRLVSASSPWSFFPRQHRRGVPSEARTLNASRLAGGRCRDAYWMVSLRPAAAGFFVSVSSRTPFSYLAVLAASSISTGSVNAR